MVLEGNMVGGQIHRPLNIFTNTEIVMGQKNLFIRVLFIILVSLDELDKKELDLPKNLEI